MALDWIEDGLRQTRERAEQRRLASERRHDQSALIRKLGPDFMRALVTRAAAAVDEYRRRTNAEAHEIEFVAVPHEGLSVTRTAMPKVELECRPDYEAHAVYCNLARADEPDSENVERVFRLEFAVDEADNIELRCRERVFRTPDAAVEFLLKPVFFPFLYDRH